MITVHADDKPLVERFMRDHEHAAACKTDSAFIKLMLLQWAVMVICALWLTPITWYGLQPGIHPHVLAAFFGGGVLSLLPMLFVWWHPGERTTRHVIAAFQMLTSSLLIALTGGRIETHFHIFVSIAFLAFYFDWTVLLTATSVVAIDHVLRGTFFPESIFGVAAASPWRWLEHAGWLVMCDIFLISSSFARRRNLRVLGETQVQQGNLLTKAYNDTLTGLPNRLRFQHWIAELLESRRETHEPFALMYIDLDRFKEINDGHGHAAGDQVLSQVARRLSEYAGPHSLLARLGGDEFVAVFSEVPNRAKLADISEEITASLMLPFQYKGEQLSLGASIGISIFPEHGVQEGELLHRADQAMYRVKLQGRRGYSFYEQPDSDAGSEGDLIAALESALSRDEFEIHYQPFVDSASRLTGFEALVRWRCPVRGLVPPIQFIPAAESSGFILPLGRMVLAKAIQQAAAWRAQDLTFGFITVNVSPLQLTERGFVPYVESLLQEHSLPVSFISLECTESACASDPVVQRCLEALRERGLRIYIDDFGTGYSSLGRLQEMRFDTIKIDRAFVSRLTVSETGREIVGLMISFAHLLGMTVVAEGVETNDQYNILQGMGCDHIQGYLISRPLPSSEAAGFIRLRQATVSPDSQPVLSHKAGTLEPPDRTPPSRWTSSLPSLVPA